MCGFQVFAILSLWYCKDFGIRSNSLLKSSAIDTLNTSHIARIRIVTIKQARSYSILILILCILV